LGLDTNFQVFREKSEKKHRILEKLSEKSGFTVFLLCYTVPYTRSVSDTMHQRELYRTQCTKKKGSRISRGINKEYIKIRSTCSRFINKKYIKGIESN